MLDPWPFITSSSLDPLPPPSACTTDKMSRVGDVAVSLPIFVTPLSPQNLNKVIDLADERQLASISAQLSAQLPAVKRCPYGKHIVSRLERATGQVLHGP